MRVIRPDFILADNSGNIENPMHPVSIYCEKINEGSLIYTKTVLFSVLLETKSWLQLSPDTKRRGLSSLNFISDFIRKPLWDEYMSETVTINEVEKYSGTDPTTIKSWEETGQVK